MVEVVRRRNKLLLTGNAVKKCCRCQQLKQQNEFNSDRSRPSGLSSRCKPCEVEYQQRYREANPKQATGNPVGRPRKANGEPKAQVTAEVHPAAWEKPIPRGAFNDGFVVDNARLILSQSGWSHRRLLLADLGEVMTEANRLLASDGQPQLGKNPAWKHE